MPAVVTEPIELGFVDKLAAVGEDWLVSLAPGRERHLLTLTDPIV